MVKATESGHGADNAATGDLVGYSPPLGCQAFRESTHRTSPIH